jgi:hypothetical protein
VAISAIIVPLPRESDSEEDAGIKQARTVLIKIFAEGLTRRIGDALDH